MYNNSNIPDNLFILKHKDLDVAMVSIDLSSGKIEHILDIYLPDELPVGCDNQKINTIISWWESRAIPDSRRGIQQVLHYLNENSNLSLMLSGYGLSLTDHYWMQPIGLELYWKDLNYYENDFSDELGSLLTDSEKIDISTNISKFSPSSSVVGEMKKKWIIKNNTRCLMKINTNHYGQQAVNERIASEFHKRTGWKNYEEYEIEWTKIEDETFPCSLNPLFTSEALEFVSAYQLISNYKTPNDTSNYEMIIKLATEYGLAESTVRSQLEYTILSDFILSNTDRHFNNFGFLYDSQKKAFVSMAPIFDTGNALFYSNDIIPQGKNLLDIQAASFCHKEVDMLRYVSNKYILDLNKLNDFSDYVRDTLVTYTDMPQERSEQIARTINTKLEYLRLYQQGKKIWKAEKYW